MPGPPGRGARPRDRGAGRRGSGLGRGEGADGHGREGGGVVRVDEADAVPARGVEQAAGRGVVGERALALAEVLREEGAQRRGRDVVLGGVRTAGERHEEERGHALAARTVAGLEVGERQDARAEARVEPEPRDRVAVGLAAGVVRGVLDLAHDDERVERAPVVERGGDETAAHAAAPASGGDREVEHEEDARVGEPLADDAGDDAVLLDDAEAAQPPARVGVEQLLLVDELGGRERRHEDVAVQRAQQRGVGERDDGGGGHVDHRRARRRSARARPRRPGPAAPVYYRDEVTTAVCPGSFDPITLGHLDIVRRARALFDEVVVGVARNASKSALLSVDERVDLARSAVRDAGLDGVRVEVVPGLLVDFCRDVGATAVVKGLRGGADFDAELPMALMNRHLAGVETVFVAGDAALLHVASSLVKDIARYGGPVDDLVPPGVGDAVRAALARTQGTGR